MMEEKPANMEKEAETPPVEQPEVEVPAPSFLEKLKIHKFKILGGILGTFVLAGAVFGAYKFSQKKAQPSPQPTPSPVVTPLPTPSPEPTPESTPTPEPTVDWKTHTNSKCGFSIKYPDELTVDETRGCVHFSLWGPTQKTETEFFDGISLLFDSDQLGNKTLKELAEEEAAMFQDVGEVLIPPTQTTIAGVSGYTFKASGLGVFTYFYLSPKPGVYLEIVDSTVDPTGKGFQKTVDLMLSTLKLL